MASNTDCIDPIYTEPLVPQPLPEDDCSCEGGGGGGEGHKYTFSGTATGFQVKEDNRVIYTYVDKNDNTTYSWQATSEGWTVKDNKGNVVFTYKDKDQDTTYSFEKKDDCGFKVTNSKGEVVFDYDNDCAGTTYSFEQDGVDIKVTDNKTNTLVFTYKGTVDTTYNFEDYKKGFKVTDSKGVVAYIYDPDFDPSDGSYPIDTLLTTVIKGHTTISTGQIMGFTPANLVVGETLVYDGVGTVGVITKDNGDGTYEVTTMTISPGTRQGVRLGSVEEEENLPATCAAAEAMGWQTPQLGDFAYVTKGGQGDEISEYVITNVDDDCNLTWTFSHSFNAGDYQAQSTTAMSGMILTGGAVQGTFGTPIDPSTLIRGVKRNGILLTPDAQGKVNVIVDDSHIIVNALPTTGIVDKAEYIVIDANQKVTGTWVHDATGWYQTYEPPVNVKSHQIVTSLPTTNIEENVEYIIVDADGKLSQTWVYDPTLGWIQTEVKARPAHVVVKDLPTTGINDEAEYVQVSDLNDPVNTYVASYVHTAKGWVKTAENLTATQAHIAVTALPTTNINENAEYLVMTDTSNPATLSGTYVRVKGNWVQTEKMENGFHIVTSLPTSNIDDKNDYIVVENLSKPDETLIGHYAYDSASKKWISLNSKYVVNHGVTMNGYTVNADEFQDMPVGAVAPFFGTKAPAHYLIANGATYNIGTYPELEAFIIENYGKVNQFGGNGTTTWAVPDLRGEFLRGAGTNGHSGQGSGAVVGAHQNATNNPYTFLHGDRLYYKSANPGTGIANLTPVNADAVQSVTNPMSYQFVPSTPYRDTTAQSLSYSARPTNTSVNWCIKAESTYAIVPNNNHYSASATATYTIKSATMTYPVMSAKQGMTSMISNDGFVAPVDGTYAISIMFPEVVSRWNSYFGTYVYVNGTIKGGTRSQTGNGSGSSTMWNDTYSLNSDNTIRLKKGDTVRIGVWVQFQSASATYTNTGTATIALLQAASSTSVNKAEMMMKPNTWPSGVEQDFGDGVYGMRIKGTISAAAGATTITPVAGVSGSNVNLINYGGWTQASNGDLNRAGVPYNVPDLTIGMFIRATDNKLCIYSKEVSARTNVPYDVWVLYTKA